MILCKYNLLNVLLDFLIFILFNFLKFSLCKKLMIIFVDYFKFFDNVLFGIGGIVVIYWDEYVWLVRCWLKIC